MDGEVLAYPVGATTLLADIAVADVLASDLFRQVKRRLHSRYDPITVRVAAASIGEGFPSLWIGDDEVMKWPVGDVPEHSIFAYLCTHPECAQSGYEPFACHRGDPPQGIERRGLEFLQEPGNCGHNVQRRLVARGADAILTHLSHSGYIR